jgi:hypothetical protein
MRNSGVTARLPPDFVYSIVEHSFIGSSRFSQTPRGCVVDGPGDNALWRVHRVWILS